MSTTYLCAMAFSFDCEENEVEQQLMTLKSCRGRWWVDTIENRHNMAHMIEHKISSLTGCEVILHIFNAKGELVCDAIEGVFIARL